MDPYYTDDAVTLHHGDCRNVLPDLAPESVDAVVCDPPYELGFMGRTWDSSGVAYQPKTWAAVLRTLKPGGHLLAFGGTRTYHRMTVAIEDAGFEVRDCLSWLYGQGFPKSLDVSKAIDKSAGAERPVVGQNPNFRDPEANASHHERWNSMSGSGALTVPATDEAAQWDGWGTALKPAHEPIVLARKPLSGTVAGNVLEYGTGALNIDGCRIEGTEDTARPQGKDIRGGQWSGNGGRSDRVTGGGSGRWPANVVLDPAAAALLDQQSGVLHSQDPATRQSGKASGGDLFDLPGMSGCYDDRGGASRFFYCAKASSAERPQGDETHPTVKPLDLMRWLVRLVTPPGGTVLDPFAGSGTTGEAAIVEGFRSVLVESHAAYLPLIVSRLSKPIQPTLT